MAIADASLDSSKYSVSKVITGFGISSVDSRIVRKMKSSQKFSEESIGCVMMYVSNNPLKDASCAAAG